MRPINSHSEPADSVVEPSVYDSRFWAAYVSNTTLMIAVSLMFRYSDFVSALGGDAADLGWITGIGTIGALLMRLLQGDAIDRLGARTVWVVSMLVYAGSLWLHTRLSTVETLAVYGTSLLMYAGLSGAFGASLTFISLRAPRHRVTEVIGMLGSSGFLGMAIGPFLGDWIFEAVSGGSGAAAEGVRLLAVQRLMLSAAGFACVSLVAAALATWRVSTGVVRSRRRPPSTRLVGRYQPGFLLVVAAAMGLGIGLFQVFVRPFAEHLGVAHLRVFFLTYAAVAFTVRLSTRTLPSRLGEARMIYLGLGCLSVALLSFLGVRSEWGLVVPAAISGTAHAFLFPAVVSSGAAAFPVRYRGLATTLVLASFDMGNLIGRPVLGQVVTLSESWGWDGYCVMFVMVASLLALVAACYAWRQSLRGSGAALQGRRLSGTSKMSKTSESGALECLHEDESVGVGVAEPAGEAALATRRIDDLSVHDEAGDHEGARMG